ncbi:AMP-binding protein [Haliea sp. E1-2-M8]|uniref:AMP-binding protein n=1 Tax=Haliea sp. E1-2-M8 TaxID=3064706 RepID=UPI00271AFDD1|nr:AMP-binding protein [Haliea sp. E1-2-M8]MDO8862654.1 AMP-binding protein [Haliea sp. E1-2-M8]
MDRQLTLSALDGPTDQPLLYQTIGAAFDATVARFPDHEALVVRHQGVRWSYLEYQRRVDDLACGLLALGVEAGERVGIWGPNSSEWCLTQFATAKIGAIMVCINPAYRLYELEYALNKVQCRTLITAQQFKTSDYLGMLQSLAPELQSCTPGALRSQRLPHLQRVIQMGTGSVPGMLDFAEVCASGTAADRDLLQQRADSLSPADAINIQFTSGTTGNPKGATLTHLNILNNGKLVGDGMRLTEHDRLCIPVPLYHCFGMVMGNLACITHGATAVFPSEAFDPAATLATVAGERCTALHGVPTMFIAELDLPDFNDYDLSSLRTGIMAGATCPVEVMKRVVGRMHMEEVLIAYGQTETSPVNHMTSSDDSIDKRVSTVGRPAPHCEIKIVDAEGKIVPVGEKGEICCRGYSVMRGYWDDPERTAETIDRDGWLHSGDIGVMDAEGYTQITGRIKDMIIRGGENIYPREVEEFLYTHPEIQEAQVFGITDHRYGEQVCAWIKLREGSSLEVEHILEYCVGQITHFKIPRHVRLVEEFPMTVTGKIQKFLMREHMSRELGIETGNPGDKT